MQKPTFQMSSDTRLIIAELKKAKIGDLITDQQLEAAISGTNEPAVRTALRRLARDEGMVFGRVRMTGWRRLSSAEIVNTGAADIDKIRRQAKRSVERQMHAEFDDLTNPQKLQFTSQVSIAGAVAAMTTSKALTTVASKAQIDRREIPVAEISRMFSKSDRTE